MYVAPEFPKAAFTCPHCQVLTTQAWGKLEPTMSTVTKAKSDLWQSTCFHCAKSAYWRGSTMLYPTNVTAPLPSPDLSEELQADYQEAREIVNASPRGAAALLRLVIQKLMKELGEEGRDINTDIGELVKKGRINVRTQRMLDSVRVVGNEAVHPGVLDLNDDRELANSLFDLVNLIVFDSISYDKYVNSLYEKLPENKRKGIEDRDRPKQEKAS